MAETPSTLTLAPGTPAPDFVLPDPSGARHALGDVRGERATVVAFVCNHCPYVVHVASALGRLAEEFAGRGVGFVAINANDFDRYPDDAPDRMSAFARDHGWSFPYLVDETQEVAKAYAAACTPDFYAFDGDLRLAYCGRFDPSRPGSGEPVSGVDLRAALEAVLDGRPVPSAAIPSTGCNIKWKPGREPDWFG